MSERQNNTSEIGATPETNQDILAKQSASVQKIIEKDPILSKNLDQITNPKEFFEKLAQSTHIFEQTDNLSSQTTFLEQSLKGLEYGQYTQDGREFAKLSDEEVGKLNDADAEKYLAWLEKMENEQKQKTIKIQERRQDVQAQLIDLQEKNAKAGEENQKIIDTLSPNGKSFLDTELQKARTDINNPVYRDLVSKGIDPNKGDFENILRASIILANAETLKKESNNQDVFNNSLRELGKLGIPYPVKSDIPSISAHIDARFPRGESTERAKGEITRSIESGNVSSIYYDGKGEKYTLLDKDGKTSKEVYMNPPRIRVAQNGFEAEEKIVPSDDTKKRVEKLGELGVIQGKTKEKIGKIGSDLSDVFNKKLPQENTDEYMILLNTPVFSENFPTLQDSNTPTSKRIESAEKLIQTYREARDKPTINKDLYDRKIHELDEVKRGLQEEIKLQGVIASIPTTSSEDFENNVKANFATLSTDPRLYNRFPRPQELLTGILGEINRTRDTRNQIQIGEKVLGQSEKRSIDEAYEKIFKYLGTDSSILKSAEIGSINPKINELLQGNQERLRKILGNQEQTKSSV